MSVCGGASVSVCERYRYALWRDWDRSEDLFTGKTGQRVFWIMLNPSTADEEADDPTIRRCLGFARSWGYDGIIVANLFGYRATDPSELGGVDDPVGPQNDETIECILRSSLTDLVVCAWGANAPKEREAEVLRMIRGAGCVPHALRLTKSGSPGHPLYLPKTCEPFALKDTIDSLEGVRMEDR